MGDSLEKEWWSKWPDFLALLLKSKFSATLFSKTIDFDQPFENARFKIWKNASFPKSCKIYGVIPDTYSSLKGLTKVMVDFVS